MFPCKCVYSPKEHMIKSARDKIKEINENKQKVTDDEHKDGEESKGTLLQTQATTTAQNTPTAVDPNLLVQLKASASMSEEQLVQLGLALTPDDDDRTENDEECAIRTKKVLDAARTEGKSSIVLTDMQNAFARECARKRDLSRATARDNVLRQIWFNIRAETIKFTGEFDALVADYLKLNAVMAEKKP
eukprot:c11154_g1_i3.p1 GENE.c11154_g1_i3~~c11154_g1_i3.p1  ORF type:complete len:189 (+),score=61.49 c11154_g1_i3:251-817(+)